MSPSSPPPSTRAFSSTRNIIYNGKEYDGHTSEGNHVEMLQWCLDNGYKIPKWLLMIGIKCPFNRASIYHGKHGPVNYQLVGPESGPLVIGFHGLGANIATFGAYIDVMINNGYRFLTFDLYGHGLSGYPRYRIFGNTFTVDFFVNQADELLTHLKLQHCQVAAVVGVSMGTIIAAGFCRRHPHLVERCIFISPAGLIPKRPKKVTFLKAFQCCIPCIPRLYCKCCFSFHVRKANEGVALDATTNRVLWSLFVTRRAPTSFLGLVNRMPLWTGKSLYQYIGKFGKPTLCIFGAQDTLTPPSSAPKFCALMPNCHVVVFSQADHLVSFKLTCQVSSLWLGFLGIPANARVADYKFWLPFDSLGRYIPRGRRMIMSRIDDVTADVGGAGSRGATDADVDTGGLTIEPTRGDNHLIMGVSTSLGVSTSMGACGDRLQLGFRGEALDSLERNRLAAEGFKRLATEGFDKTCRQNDTSFNATTLTAVSNDGVGSASNLYSKSDEFKDAIDYDDVLYPQDAPPLVVIDAFEQRFINVTVETSGEIAASDDDDDVDCEEDVDDGQVWVALV